MELTNTVFLNMAIGLFFSILFLQSGLDKVFDFKGNSGYIKSVFEKTPLKNISSLLFITITILEVSAGAFSFAGVLYYYFKGSLLLLTFGLQLSALSLLGLFFGQRISKDYAGAASLVAYFLLAVFGLYVVG